MVLTPADSESDALSSVVFQRYTPQFEALMLASWAALLTAGQSCLWFAENCVAKVSSESVHQSSISLQS